MSTIAEELALEEIVRKLEADDVELDAALALFEEGSPGCVRRATG
jgi:exodeoxyribonuclease VII small subunit